MEILKLTVRICLLLSIVGVFAGIGYIFGLWGLIVGLLSVSHIVLLIQQSQMKKMIRELYAKYKS